MSLKRFILELSFSGLEPGEDSDTPICTKRKYSTESEDEEDNLKCDARSDDNDDAEDDVDPFENLF